MIKITVTSKKYNCTIQLNQKVTVIVGDSGKGKTLFTKAISTTNEAYKVNISDDSYSISALGQNWYDIVSSGIDNNNKRIYVIDDNDIVLSKEFSHLFSRDKLCFYVVINRFQNITLKSLNRIPFSTKEVYSFVSDGKEHHLEKHYKYSISEVQANSVNEVLIENSNAGKEFFTELFNSANVTSTNGKDKVLKYLIDNKEMLENKNTLLIVDLSAFGSWFQSVYEFVCSSKLNLVMLTNYDSFEYMLLRSNMFNYSFENIENGMITSEVSFEELCTKILQQETLGKPYVYTKSKLNKCYVVDCCVIQKGKVNNNDICDKGMKGNKLVGLLINTEFNELLEVNKN